MTLVEEVNHKTEKVIRIVQITDTHLCANPDAMMLGVNVNESFADVVSLVRQQQRQIDCLLGTGDLSQDASVEAYQHFDKVMSTFSSPHLWLSGNHDILDNIKLAVGADSACLNKVHTLAGWQIIMLDSSVKGKTYGFLSAEELAFLDEALSASSAVGLNTLIGVHHNPVPVNAQWLQNICLRNSDDFFSVIDKYEQVKGVLFGHIHQNLEQERNGVLMMGSPSTCIQFHPDNDDFTLDDINPGYRWLELSPEGAIKTGVQRVEGKCYDVDFTSAGY